MDPRLRGDDGRKSEDNERRPGDDEKRRRCRRPLRTVTAIALLLLAGCWSSAGERKATPAIWSFSDADTTIYLFGTIHVLPDNIRWDDGRVARLIDESDRLMLEVNEADGVEGLRKAFQSLAQSPVSSSGLPPIDARIAPEHRAALDAMIRSARLPRAQLDTMETWAVALTLAASQYGEFGASPEDGVEAGLSRRFTQAGKPIEALETATEQLGYFDRLPEPAQRDFLTSVVTGRKEAVSQFEVLLDAWSKGDVDRLGATADDEASLSPVLADALKRQRNAGWTKRLIRELDRPGTMLVAVGTAHLAGRDSLQQMLQARGISVRRIQ